MDKNKIAVGVFNKLANVYQDKFMDVSLYHDSFDVFCNNIKTKGADILELACGPGNITQYLLEKRPDFQIFGVDLAPNMVELAQINNPSAAFQVMDCRDIGLLDKKYDGVMCGFCLPYLSKEEAITLIMDAGNLLRPQGVLYLSTMEDDYSKSGFKKGSTGDEIYMYYHQGDYLASALLEQGFRIVDIRRQEYPTEDGLKTTDLVVIAAK